MTLELSVVKLDDEEKRARNEKGSAALMSAKTSDRH